MQDARIAATVVAQQVVTDKGVFVGDVSNGRPHGKGVLYFNQENIEKYKTDLLDGHFVEGKFMGGRVQQMTLPNGATYKGEVNGDVKAHGRGNMTYVSTYYDGSFSNGMLHGSGVLCSGTMKHVGLFEKNKAHGMGMRIQDGVQHIGFFHQGVANGFFFVITPRDSSIVIFVMDRPQQYVAKFAHTQAYTPA